MKTLTRIFAAIGFMVCMSFLISLVVELAFAPKRPVVPTQAVLTLDLNGVSNTLRVDALAAMLGDGTLPLPALIHALDRASKDDRVKGLIANVSDVNLGPASIEELRAAIKRFRAAGKFTYAYADSFGEIGPGNRPYWLASAFDRITLQPLGSVGLTGAAMTLPFARDALDKIGIMPDVRQRYEYKGAAENLTETTMTPPLRENYQKLLDDVHHNMLADISTDRSIKLDELEKLVDQAPLLDKEALEHKLVDALDYADTLWPAAQKMAGDKAEKFDVADYLAALDPLKGESKATVALINVDGPIVRRADDAGPTGERKVASAEELAAAIASAGDDKDIKAIILRINSPGGSVPASETIHRALLQAKAQGKFIVVSMNELAASGGYWIATAADKIVADPSTLTGSIGVVGGKMVIAGLSDKLGINWVDLSTGANSNMFSPAHAFNAAEAARINASLDQIYETFTQRVAEGRHLKPEQIDALARGRVWTGVSAKEVGLVDELGGLDDAIKLVRTELKLADDDIITLKLLPEEPGLAGRVLSFVRQFITAPTLQPLSYGALLQGLALMLHTPTSPTGTLTYTGPVVAN